MENLGSHSEMPDESMCRNEKNVRGVADAEMKTLKEIEHVITDQVDVDIEEERCKVVA